MPLKPADVAVEVFLRRRQAGLPGHLTVLRRECCAVSARHVGQVPLHLQHVTRHLGRPVAGGDDGMDIIRRILASAPDYLSERGAILLEIGNEYENFKKAFPQIPAIWMEVSAGEEQVLLIQAEDLR